MLGKIAKHDGTAPPCSSSRTVDGVGPKIKLEVVAGDSGRRRGFLRDIATEIEVHVSEIDGPGCPLGIAEVGFDLHRVFQLLFLYVLVHPSCDAQCENADDARYDSERLGVARDDLGGGLGHRRHVIVVMDNRCRHIL